MIDKEKFIRELLKIEDIVRYEPVKLKHGESTYYVDIKKAYGYPNVLKLLSKYMREIMDERTTCVAASGYGGNSLATALSIMYDLKLTLVRDEEKKHGKGGWLDGYIPTEEDFVAVVDDVGTTGGTLKEIISHIEPTGAKIIGCYVVVKRDDFSLDYPLHWLLTTDENGNLQ